MAQRGRKLPPLEYKDFRRVLLATGYVSVGGGDHDNYEHPDRPGKVSLDKKWRNVKVGDWVFRSVVMEQAGMTKKEFVELYWETR